VAIIGTGVALALFILLNGITGVRLLWLATRTRELPELYLGIGHLLGGSLGWALLLLGYLVAPPKTSLLGLTLMLSGLACLNVAHLAVSLFAWRVFSPERRAFVVLYAVLVLTLTVDFVHNGLLAHEFAPPPDTFWFWPGALMRSVAWVWLTIATFRYHRKLRKRLALGLANPVTTNRIFLLFMSGSLIVTLAVVVNTASVLGIWIRFPLLIGTISLLLAMPSAVFSWLAFVPPKRYTDWIARRAPVVAE
jgi:hypothetical protein